MGGTVGTLWNYKLVTAECQAESLDICPLGFFGVNYANSRLRLMARTMFSAGQNSWETSSKLYASSPLVHDSVLFRPQQAVYKAYSWLCGHSWRLLRGSYVVSCKLPTRQATYLLYSLHFSFLCFWEVENFQVTNDPRHPKQFSINLAVV